MKTRYILQQRSILKETYLEYFEPLLRANHSIKAVILKNSKKNFKLLVAFTILCKFLVMKVRFILFYFFKFVKKKTLPAPVQ